MKRKITIFMAVATIVVIGAFLAIEWQIVRPIIVEAACSVANCREQGGSRWTIGNGGSLDVLSGGEIDIESGGTFKSAGAEIVLPTTASAFVVSTLLANVDLDDSANTDQWTVSDDTNWTIDDGTSNNRAGGNGFELKTDNTENDELLLDNGSAISNADGANYLGFWIRNEGGTIVGTEFDVDLRDSGSSGITNCTELQVPAVAQSNWSWVELDVSACDLSDVQQFALVADSGITANTAIDLEKPIFYNISNGHGPARGRLEYVPVATGTVTKGQVVCWPDIGTDTNGVATCGANDYAPAGIATSTSTTFTTIQTSGYAVMVCGNAVTDNADVDVLSGAVTIDDAGGQENSIGYATEAGAATGDMIYIRLQF